MKLIVRYSKPLQGEDRLLPRDIRNYVASITKEDDDVHNEIMGHKRIQPTFIFPMGNRKSFAIYTFKEDAKTKKMMQTIKKRINENKELRLNGVKVTIASVEEAVYKFTNFEEGLLERRLRSPLVIAKAEYEYAICRKLSEGDEVNMTELKKYTASKIKDTICVMARDWFDTEEETRLLLEDATIMFKDLEYTPIEYKKGFFYPAVRGTILCDVKLPQFIGYLSGLGYGELSTMKEMDRRRKPRHKGRKK